MKSDYQTHVDTAVCTQVEARNSRDSRFFILSTSMWYRGIKNIPIHVHTNSYLNLKTSTISMHYPIVIFILISVISHRHRFHSGYQQQYLLAPLAIQIFFTEYSQICVLHPFNSMLCGCDCACARALYECAFVLGVYLFACVCVLCRFAHRQCTPSAGGLRLLLLQRPPLLQQQPLPSPPRRQQPPGQPPQLSARRGEPQWHGCHHNHPHH